jgi:DNA-binding transcriptional LysR family regulator
MPPDDLRRFDLNLMIVFDALMQERSVSRAAERLLLGQPAVSQSLARLREVLDDPLFVRGGTAMRPTPRALELAGPVSEILAQVRARVLSRPHFDPGLDRGTVRVGVNDFAEVGVMHPLLKRLRSEAPHVQVVLRPAVPETVATMLENGSIDLSLGPQPVPSAAIVSETLFHDDIVCAFDPLVCGIQPPVELPDYVRLPHIVLSESGVLHGSMDEHLRALGETRFVAVATTHLLTIPWMLHDMRAIALLPRSFAEHCVSLTRLAMSDLPLGRVTFAVHMLWHQRTAEDSLQGWFRDLVRQTASGRAQSAAPAGTFDHAAPVLT